MNWIAKKIIETRMIKGLTQEELAEKATLNLRTIQRIENAENEPRGKTLKLICDALEISSEELFLAQNSIKKINIGTRIMDGLYLLGLNLILISIIGYLTLDINANKNSFFGGLLLSLFLNYFIVTLTKKMSGIERMLKYGIGYIVYFIAVMIMHGFVLGIITGLFPCLLISITVLYFGKEIMLKITV